MGTEQDAGCVRPTAAAAVASEDATVSDSVSLTEKKEQAMIHVGRKAPDFSAPGYFNGAFVNDVKLSDYLGKWVVLCFYPGDFTFV